MLTLTLDGSEVDLPADAAVALTLWAHDLRSASTREATFTETFTLPLTARNKAALRAPHVLGSQTTAPYRRLPAVLRAGSVALLDGVAHLEQASGEGFEVTLYGATADLFALVGTRALRELDLSAYDHPLSYATVAAAQANPQALGYAYPLVDDGRLERDEPDTRVYYHELPPFVLASTLLRQVVAECLPGYTLTGSLLSEDRFQRLGFPRARPWPALRQSVREALRLNAATAYTFAAEEPTGDPDGEVFPVVPFADILSAGSAAPFVLEQYFEVPAGLPVDVLARVNLRLNVTAPPQALRPAPLGEPSLVEVRLISDPNGQAGPVATQVGAAVPVFFGYLIQGLPVPALPTDLRLPLEHTFTHLAPGTVVAVQIRLRGGMGIEVLPGSTVVFEAGERTYAGGPVHLEAGLPDLSQADFLQLLANAFHLVVQADHSARVVRADLFTDLERNRNRAVDWTAKLDYTTRPATTFRLDGYAQRNRFAYDAPPDAYQALDVPVDALTLPGVLPVPDTTLEATRDAYTAPVFVLRPRESTGGLLLPWLPAVAPTDRNYRAYDNTKSYSTEDHPIVYGGRYYQPIYEGPGSDPGEPPGTTPGLNSVIWVEVPESAVLTVQNDELPAVALLTPWPVDGGAVLVRNDPEDATTTPAAHTLTPAGLDWEADLLPAYYPSLRALLSQARVLALPFTLSAVDIAAVDHLRPVRLSVTHWPGVGAVRGLFYLNLIDQYVPGSPGPVLVELIKLGDPIAGLASEAAPLVERPLYPQRLESGEVFKTEDGITLIEENGL